MLRKLSLVAVAAASLGAAALAPAPASAHGWHYGGWHRIWLGCPPRLHRRPGLLSAGGFGGCYVRRLIPTPFGLRWRLVNRCY